VAEVKERMPDGSFGRIKGKMHVLNGSFERIRGRRRVPERSCEMIREEGCF